MNLPASITADDLDGDGDLDLLSASRGDDKIAWYENMDDAGTFGSQQLISTIVDSTFSAHAGDVDGDGDQDLIHAFRADDGSGGRIAWYENTDGQGSFGPAAGDLGELDWPALGVCGRPGQRRGSGSVVCIFKTMTRLPGMKTTARVDLARNGLSRTEADSARSVYAADLDADGDLDVLSASWNDDKIAWYENIDGAGSFGPQQVITTQADGARWVHAADLDSDGDLDVLSASQGTAPNFDDEITWYENTDGVGSFRRSG